MGINTEQIKRMTVLEQDTPNYMAVDIETDDGRTYEARGKNAVAITDGVVQCAVKGTFDFQPTRKRTIVAVFAMAHEVPIRYRVGQSIPVPGMEEVEEAYERYGIGTWRGREDECPWIYAKGQLDGWKD